MWHSLLRCDRGSNFVSAKSEIDEALAEMDSELVANYLSEQNCEWDLQPTPRVSLRRCMGTSDWYHATHPRRHALGVRGATADPWVAGYHNVRSCGDTIRYWRTFTVDTSDAAYAKDTSAWTTSRYLHDTGCLCSTEMEKVAIPSRSILDQVETRVYPKSPGADEVEQRTAKSSSWRHRPDERRASPPKQSDTWNILLKELRG